MGNCKIAVIGGGPAGLAAAVAAKKYGVDDVLIIDRDNRLGGILNQCIHNGFGLHTFNEELTGPEYAARFVDEVDQLGIRHMLNTMVLDINERKEITVLNSVDGLIDVKAEAVVLAMGCRERPRGALNIPGYRPAGIYTAGTAQRLINIEGYMPGKEIVILGSGDIGLIMARRLTLEGAAVKVVAEIMPYSGGLKRNIVQCLDDFGIPLRLKHTVVDIRGNKRVEGVTIAKVDKNRSPIKGTEEYYDCDTLLLSVGLIPENELSQKINIKMNPVTNSPMVNESFETSIGGIFACGNVLHVHDLVDYVAEEAEIAGRNAAKYVSNPCFVSERQIFVRAAEGVTYTVPRLIDPIRAEDMIKVRFRVNDVYKGHNINVYFEDYKIQSHKKRILTPGEMEEVILKKSTILKHCDLKEIKIKVEKE